MLAAELERFRGTDAVVFGLARGGVPVAAEVARGLDLPLDVFVVRKLGAPGQRELALGAVASGGAIVLNQDVLSATGVDDEQLQVLVARETAEVARLELLFREGGPALDATGRAAILVDDGLATGASMAAAVQALRSREASRIVVAVPVAPKETCEALAQVADEIHCIRTPHPFIAVGSWYINFHQTTDDEVRDLLATGA